MKEKLLRNSNTGSNVLASLFGKPGFVNNVHSGMEEVANGMA